MSHSEALVFQPDLRVSYPTINQQHPRRPALCWACREFRQVDPMAERQSSHQEGQGSPPRQREGEWRDSRPGMAQEGFLEGVSSRLGFGGGRGGKGLQAEMG